MLRCQVPDRPGALAELAGAIAAAGGDIEAVDVVESQDGTVLDDLFVVVQDSTLRELVGAVEALPEVRLVHAGPSRGHPSDAVTRLAVGLQSLLDGAMTPEHAITALVSGLLHATAVLVPAGGAVPEESARCLVVPFDGTYVVARRDYRFTQTERERAEAILRACAEATRAVGDDAQRSSSSFRTG